MSDSNAPYVFNTAVDRNLRVVFNASVGRLVWYRYYEGTSCTNFFAHLDENFESYVSFLQDMTIEVVQDMFRSRMLLTPHITIEDIFRFFNQEDPLFQLYNHCPSRRGLRYAIRCCYLRWMGSQEDIINNTT